jgi:hypothetical protein
MNLPRHSACSATSRKAQDWILCLFARHTNRIRGLQHNHIHMFKPRIIVGVYLTSVQHIQGLDNGDRSLQEGDNSMISVIHGSRRIPHQPRAAMGKSEGSTCTAACQASRSLVII